MRLSLVIALIVGMAGCGRDYADGYYCVRTKFTGEMIHLNKHRFQYWAESDVELPPGKAPKYPFEGQFQIDKDGVITLEHPQLKHRRFVHVSKGDKKVLVDKDSHRGMPQFKPKDLNHLWEACVY